MLSRLISRFLRARDRRRQPRAVVITPAQWALYLNNQQYRDRRTHHGLCTK
jgi:hypothetical protein